ncbi:MAG: hypothetical protein KAW40_00215 [Candidatus Aenigmarchaeota archaeon]|nr:hypothetical protein [Candidatus Aenigmarchaeota archaeon]
MNRKIILSIVLTVCLVFAMFPVEVQAKQTSLLGMILDILFPQLPQPPFEYETEHIKILNPVSKPTLWGRWIVRFETEGGGDLEIEAFRGTFFEKDIEFIALTCDDERVEVEKYFSEKGKNEPWVEGIDNGKIVARNWNCDNKTGRLFLRILATGHHYLKFSFLGETVYAENLADCTGTFQDPCHKCDVSDMDFLLRDPGDSNDPRDWQDMTYDSETGECNCTCYTEDCCPTSDIITEKWEDIDGYTFCPSEGDYDAQTRAYAEGDAYEWETSSWFIAVYNVNYDTNENWCDCNQTATGCNGLSCWQDTNPMGWEAGTSQDCCGDDAIENYIYRTAYKVVGAYHVSWNDNTSDDACCDNDEDCVDDGTCYSNGQNTDITGVANDTRVRCNGGSEHWLDVDYGSSGCTGAGYDWSTAGETGVGEYGSSNDGGDGTTECCGDDNVEEYLARVCDNTDGSIQPSPYSCESNSSDDACCDTSTDCVHSETCYTSGTHAHDVDGNGDDEYCSSSTWYDCSDTGDCDPAGENAYGESNNACFDGSECTESCISNDCHYIREPGYSDCDNDNACDDNNADGVGDGLCAQFVATGLDDPSFTIDPGLCDASNGCVCSGSCTGTWDVCTTPDGCPWDSDRDGDMNDCGGSGAEAGNCYAPTGSTSYDVDGDNDNDYCVSNTWYDCNTDSQCISPYECVSNDCQSNISGGSGTTCDASNPCLYIENSTDVVARFDQFGYVDVKGGYSPSQSSLSPPAGSFQVTNSTGEVVLYIDDDGNLALLGNFTTQSSPSPSGGNDFIVQNSTDIAGYVDGETGNMYFKGSLHYNSDF